MSGVSGVNNHGYTNYTKNSGKTNTKTEQAVAEEEAAVVFEKSESSGTEKTYSRDTVKLTELRTKDKAYIQNLQNVVSQLVNQVNKNGMADGKSKFNGSMHGSINPDRVESYWDLLVDNGDGTFSFHPDLSPEAQQGLIDQAKIDIGEDGYYGVKQTSQRILDFAKAITGGDPSKVEDMRKYIQDGFNEVKSMFGGELPEICNQTYDAIMKGLDEWAASAAK